MTHGFMGKPIQAAKDSSDEIVLPGRKKTALHPSGTLAYSGKVKTSLK